ncbi:phospholipid scramblase-related protein [Actinomadura adrarensis]|uniref:Phospholipid scramblase-related protein n=1 Tax=Actinomadura adrarensis TaxID=1819600 RepID=A0ABW3CLE0_9ACTN
MAARLGTMRPMHDLFSSPMLRVDQPRGVPGAKSRYKIFNGQGTQVALATERDVSTVRKALRAVFGSGERIVEVENLHGRSLLVVMKMSTSVTVTTPDGAVIGSITGHTEHAERYPIQDMAGRPIGHLTSERGPVARLRRHYRVEDAYGNQVGKLEKKSKGLATALLTTADRFDLEIFHALPDPLRTMVIAAPMAIDLMFYEDKDWVPGA